MQGIAYLFQGFKLLLQPGLRGYALVPLLLNTLIFALLSLEIYHWGRQLANDWLATLPSWLSFLQGLLWPLLMAIILLVIWYFFSLVGNLLAAPFQGLLSQAVQRHLTGSAAEEAWDWKVFLRTLAPILLLQVAKILRSLLWTALFLVLFLIPGVNLVAGLLWLAFSAWSLAGEYAGYPMDNNGLSPREQRARLRRHPFSTLGFGFAVLLGTLIPVLNFMIMPVAVAGATLFWVNELRPEQKPPSA
ncbi:MAG: sulfate transporter CysZ [Magnetococcales bacterium]|nr:sulfate transporter CysZ [Magnetococcales bacterium]